MLQIEQITCIYVSNGLKVDYKNKYIEPDIRFETNYLMFHLVLILYGLLANICDEIKICTVYFSFNFCYFVFISYFIF